MSFWSHERELLKFGYQVAIDVVSVGFMKGCGIDRAIQ
jgi:hypothetical protein